MISKMPTPSVVNTSLAVYRLLLAAYPSRFRQEYGEQMIQLFRDCCLRAYHQNGSIGMVKMWAATLIDLIKSLIDEHLQKETDMSKSTFIRISGWALILGALAFSTIFLVWFVDENFPFSHWEKMYGGITYISGLWIGPILIAIGIFGVRARYGEAVGEAGKAVLLYGTILGLGLTGFGILAENIDIFARFSEAPFMFIMAGPSISMLGLAIFGFMALGSKPLPRWNWLPLLAGIVFPVLMFIGLVLRLLEGLNWVGGLVILIQVLAMIALGFILQGDVPQQEALAAA